jgi:dTDP-4-dehydrorhamnose reductase
MRVYVIGREGQVARALREAAVCDESIVFGSSGRSEIDLLFPYSIESAIASFSPDVVVNAAAYTAVDKAESEPGLAFSINRDGARAVAAAAALEGAAIIHLSTDYVFDGKKDGAYVESDPVNPQNVYGRSKLEGEIAVAEVNPRHIVLRTSWVYSPFGSNFVRTMLRLAAEGDQLRVVDDQFGCPTYALDIGVAILTIAQLATNSGWKTTFTGVTHLSGPDSISWYGFAREIISRAAERGQRSVPVHPISTLEHPTAAVRPANSCLSTARLRTVFDIGLPPMRSSLEHCLDRLLQG